MTFWLREDGSSAEFVCSPHKAPAQHVGVSAAVAFQSNHGEDTAAPFLEKSKLPYESSKNGITAFNVRVAMIERRDRLNQVDRFVHIFYPTP